MRTDFPSEHVLLRTLADLDALIGERVMDAAPVIYWEDSYANQRFDSLEEAMEAMRDPYYQLFIPEAERNAAVICEVREYPAYSAKMTTALDVVERISANGDPLHLRQKNLGWIASFGRFTECRARTAPAAISLAALRVRGICAELLEAPAGQGGTGGWR